MDVWSKIGFKKLVKIPNVKKITSREMKWMIEDFVARKTDRFDLTALQEFLDSDLTDNGAGRIQQECLELERQLIINGEQKGLWSLKGSEGLKSIAEKIPSDRK